MYCHSKSDDSEDFQNILSVDEISNVLKELNITFRSRIFTPFTTLFALVSRSLNADASFRRAVVEVNAIRAIRNEKACSSYTGSLCKAKSRLPALFFKKICEKLWLSLHEADKESNPWVHGKVRVVDGTGFSMADTKANLKIYHKHKAFNKYKGEVKESGFPIGRILAVFCLKTGALIDLKIDSWKGKGCGETSLIRKIWDCFSKGETLLADALYCNYNTISEALSAEVKIIVEYPKKMIKRIDTNKSDQIITLQRPRFNCKIKSHENLDQLPKEFKLRVIKITCAPSGFRPKVKWLATTHLDDSIVTAKEIAKLYRMRWQVELNFRSIKTEMGLNFINAKTPESIEKEIWTCMIAYNVIRTKMFQAGLRHKKLPVHLSFKAALQIVSIFRVIKIKKINIDIMIASNEVGKRPDRFEPRAIKKRPGNYALLSDSRDLAKAKLCKKSKD